MTMTAYQRIDDGGTAPDLLSVAEAARLLRISQSTLWRWIGHGLVPAYRIGPKRVWLKRSELVSITAPAQHGERHGRNEIGNGRTVERLLTSAERERGLAAIAEGRKFQAKLLAARGGAAFDPPGWELLHESREERLRHLL